MKEITKLKQLITESDQELEEEEDGVVESRTAQMLGHLGACSNFSSLKEFVSEVHLNDYPLPDFKPQSVLSVQGTADKVAKKLLKDHVKSVFATGLYPVITEVDGNCLPRSISLLVFGDQEHMTKSIVGLCTRWYLMSLCTLKGLECWEKVSAQNSWWRWSPSALKSPVLILTGLWVQVNFSKVFLF